MSAKMWYIDVTDVLRNFILTILLFVSTSIDAIPTNESVTKGVWETASFKATS